MAMNKLINNPRILITGGSSNIGFNIIRCLREVFSDVWIGAIDSLPFGPCFHSKLVNDCWLMPQISNEYSNYCEALCRLVEQLSVDIIIPGADHDTLILAYLKEFLTKRGIRFLVPHESKVNIANDKRLTSQFAQSHGIDQPRYIVAETDDAAEEFSLRIQPSLSVVKEVSTINSITPTPIATKEMACWFRHSFGSSPLIQEFVPGSFVSVTALVLPSGEISDPVAMQKIATDGHGETLEGIIVKADNIKEKSVRVLRLLDWRGAVEVEWIIDARDNLPKLLEINSRFPAWIYLTHWQKRNLPAYYVEYLCGMPVLPPDPPPPGRTFSRQPWDNLGQMEEL